MSAEQLVRYQEVIVDLEARMAILQGSRKFYIRLFLGIVPVSVLGYLWSPWLGASTFLTGILMSFFGFYVILIRESEFRTEMKQLRRRARELAAEIDVSTGESG